MTRLNDFKVVAYVNGISHIIGQIFVDEVSKLPTPTGIDGYELVQGSFAYVIKSGELYVMGGDGLWYSTDGEVVPETPVEDTVISDENQEENS